MKPWQIVLLLAGGAAGGAVVMSLVQSPTPVDAPAVVAQSQPAPAQPAPAPPVAQPEPVVAQAARGAGPSRMSPAQEPVSPAQEPVSPAPRPSPSHPPREATKPVRIHRVSARVSEPVLVAQVPPSPPATLTPPPSTPAPAPTPEPVKETPAPQPIPPARPEPENVTPPPPAPEPNRVTLNAGTLISVRLVDGLSSERNMSGDTFVATLDKELVADGFVIAERGARVEGRVVSSDPGSKLKGGASLAVELTRIHTSDGQNVAIQTDSFDRRVEESRRQDAEKIGAGAAIGAVIGAIGGGGKGAAIGAGAGGGIGAGAVVLTREPARLPSEMRLTFRLRTSVTLTERQE